MPDSGVPFPYCGWWQEISMLPAALNWAYPDQSARYWCAAAGRGARH